MRVHRVYLSGKSSRSNYDLHMNAPGIAQDELDDLLVLMPRSHRPETAASTPS